MPCDLWVISGHVAVSPGPHTYLYVPGDQPPDDTAVSGFSRSTDAIYDLALKELCINLHILRCALSLPDTLLVSASGRLGIGRCRPVGWGGGDWARSGPARQRRAVRRQRGAHLR